LNGQDLRGYFFRCLSGLHREDLLLRRQPQSPFRLACSRRFYRCIRQEDWFAHNFMDQLDHVSISAQPAPSRDLIIRDLCLSYGPTRHLRDLIELLIDLQTELVNSTPQMRYSTFVVASLMPERHQRLLGCRTGRRHSSPAIDFKSAAPL
jgi:hypothetical protein